MKLRLHVQLVCGHGFRYVARTPGALPPKLHRKYKCHSCNGAWREVVNA